MLGFSQVLKPIKWQDLLEEGKNGRNAFPTGAKIHFSEKKKYFGVRGTLKIPAAKIASPLLEHKVVDMIIW